jgi:D-tyrosyl-tRNA(Tyr) deacylase
MRVILQRVQEASVTISGSVHNKIGNGLLILAGFEDSDNDSDIEWMCNKIGNLRIFNDPEGVMNCSVIDIAGELLVISQFTLFAMTKKGNRPSYIRASKPEIAIPIYEKFLKTLELKTSLPVKAGIFGADMKVSLINDGPVTISIDTKNKE